MTTFYAGYPVGLLIEKGIPAAATITLQSPMVERALWITRLRWDCPDERQLWLMGGRIHRTPLIRESPQAPLLALSGQGTWRFARRFVQPSTYLSIDVHNYSGGTIYPGPIAFWGVLDNPKFWDEHDNNLNPVF